MSAFAVTDAPLTRAPRLASVLLCAAGIGGLLFVYHYLGALAAGQSPPLLDPLLCEMTGALGSSLLFYGVRQVALRQRLDRPDWPRRLPAHAAAVAGFGIAATSFMWGSRRLLFPLFGLGPYDYGRMPLRYLMEFPLQLIAYTLMLAGVYVAEHYAAERDKQLRTVQLEAQLAQARLANLELQLQPHFLFNALNTISTAMYEDPAAADEMLGHLAALLRGSLRQKQGNEVCLREELAGLEHYLSLLHARFGGDLEVRQQIAPDTLDLLVPSLLLQPLVENAVRHGRASRSGQGRITIEARRDPAGLQITVGDDGGGAGGEEGNGLGLSVTSQRLRLLYGDAQSFEAGPVEGGGYRVAMRLPPRSAA